MQPSRRVAAAAAVPDPKAATAPKAAQTPPEDATARSMTLFAEDFN